MATFANLAQKKWYFNASTGLNTNGGNTPSNPLRDVAEYVRRCGSHREVSKAQGFAAGEGVDLYHLTDSDEAPVIIGAEIADSDVHFRIHGSNVVMLQGNLTSLVAFDPTTATNLTINAAGLSSSHVGHRIYFPSQNAWSTIMACPTAGSLTILPPLVFDDVLQTDINRAVLTGTDAFIIYSCTIAPYANIDTRAFYPGGVNVWPPPFIIENLCAPNSITFTGAGNFLQNTMIRQCELGDVTNTGGASSYFRSCTFTTANFTAFEATAATKTKFSGCTFLGAVPNFLNSTFGYSRQDVNAFVDLVALILADATMEGTIVVATTLGGALSGLQFLSGNFIPTHNTDIVMGAQASGESTLTFARGANLFYPVGFTVYAASGVKPIVLGGVASSGNAQPSLTSAAGASVPALAPLASWSDLAASPFNGAAYDYKTLTGAQPDSI